MTHDLKPPIKIFVNEDGTYDIPWDILKQMNICHIQDSDSDIGFYQNTESLATVAVVNPSDNPKYGYRTIDSIHLVNNTLKEDDEILRVLYNSRKDFGIENPKYEKVLSALITNVDIVRGFPSTNIGEYIKDCLATIIYVFTKIGKDHLSGRLESHIYKKCTEDRHFIPYFFVEKLTRILKQETTMHSFLYPSRFMNHLHLKAREVTKDFLKANYKLFLDNLSIIETLAPQVRAGAKRVYIPYTGTDLGKVWDNTMFTYYDELGLGANLYKGYFFCRQPPGLGVPAELKKDRNGDYFNPRVMVTSVEMQQDFSERLKTPEYLFQSIIRLIGYHTKAGIKEIAADYVQNKMFSSVDEYLTFKTKKIEEIKAYEEETRIFVQQEKINLEKRNKVDYWKDVSRRIITGLHDRDGALIQKVLKKWIEENELLCLELYDYLTLKGVTRNLVKGALDGDSYAAKRLLHMVVSDFELAGIELSNYKEPDPTNEWILRMWLAFRVKASVEGWRAIDSSSEEYGIT